MATRSARRLASLARVARGEARNAEQPLSGVVEQPGEAIDPDTAVNASGDGDIDNSGGEPGERQRRKYTRRAGTAKATLDVGALTGPLLSIHAMLASMTKSPELELSEAEASALSRGIAEVNRHYPMPVNPGYVAIGALCTCAFGIYRGKLVAIAQRKAREKQAGETNGDVSPMPGLMTAPVNEPAPWFNLGNAPPN